MNIPMFMMWHYHQGIMMLSSMCDIMIHAYGTVNMHGGHGDEIGQRFRTKSLQPIFERAIRHKLVTHKIQLSIVYGVR